MEKFVIRNEDEFQRLHALLSSIAKLGDCHETNMGRRRYPMSVYMGDTKTRLFLNGNGGLYHRDAITGNAGESIVNFTLGAAKESQRKAEQGMLYLTD